MPDYHNFPSKWVELNDELGEKDYLLFAQFYVQVEAQIPNSNFPLNSALAWYLSTISSIDNSNYILAYSDVTIDNIDIFDINISSKKIKSNSCSLNLPQVSFMTHEGKVAIQFIRSIQSNEINKNFNYFNFFETYIISQIVKTKTNDISITTHSLLLNINKKEKKKTYLHYLLKKIQKIIDFQNSSKNCF